MRIGIDAHILGKGKGGVERVVHQMVRWLPDLQPDNEFVIFVNRRYVPPFPARRNVRFRWLPISEPLVQRSLILPWMAFRENLDILHVQRAAPPRSRAQLVVHVHDLLPLTARQDHRSFRDQVVRRLIPRSLRAADRVLTVSRSVADEIASLFPDVAAKVVAIPNGVDGELFQPKAADAPRAGIHGRLGLRGEYILYLGALMERKNLEVAILGFQEFLQRRASIGEAGRFKLVLAGMSRSGSHAEHLRNLAAHSKAGAIRFAGFISDTDCTALLQHASAFLAPSRGEGFDLPALEAMACAIPVLCSDIPVHRELLGEDAIFFPPDEPGKMAAGLFQLLDQPGLRAHLEMRGPKRAAAFNWEDSMRRLGDLYRGLGRVPFATVPS